ncbi:MAG: hypothetical protein U0835_05275 [Isosphaeraceae bacterium]
MESRPDLGGEQRELLSRVLGISAAAEDVERWTEESTAEEPVSPITAQPPHAGSASSNC